MKKNILIIAFLSGVLIKYGYNTFLMYKEYLDHCLTNLEFKIIDMDSNIKKIEQKKELSEDNILKNIIINYDNNIESYKNIIEKQGNMLNIQRHIIDNDLNKIKDDIEFTKVEQLDND